MTLSFSDAAVERQQTLEITSVDSGRFVGTLEPRQKTVWPIPSASETDRDGDWKENILHSTPNALCYAG
jgi:hypothetical protein